jgi:hypothetical protein
MSKVEWIIVFAIVLLLIAAFYGAATTTSDFKRVCDEVRGTVVFDGWQYQCIRIPQ